MDIIRQLLAILLLPGTMAVLIPGLILYTSGDNHLGWALPGLGSWLPTSGGLGLIAFGLFLMIQTVSLFITVGKGTLAPWDPTQKLVVRGIYRYVRNPMITGVICILTGEALLFGSASLLYWMLGFTLVNAIYMPLLEEPGLEDRFGEDYRRYKQNVPRWIPRLTPWTPPSDSDTHPS